MAVAYCCLSLFLVSTWVALLLQPLQGTWGAPLEPMYPGDYATPEQMAQYETQLRRYINTLTRPRYGKRAEEENTGGLPGVQLSPCTSPPVGLIPCSAPWSATNFSLLKQAGDVEENPGPMVSKGEELIKENMHMKLYMEGTVNNHHFKCTSEGEGKPYEGTQTGRIKVVEGGPLPFAFDILATCFMYGSKTFINHTQGIPDFFKQSFPEGFTWERVTTYEDGGVLTATQDTSLQDGCLIYNVKIRGVNFPSNGPVMQKKTLGWEASTETLYPADGGLEGRCDMALKLVGGGHLICNLKTTYRSKKPAKNLKMPGVYFVDRRLERIKEADNETYVEQHEVAVARYCDLPSKLGHKLNGMDELYK